MRTDRRTGCSILVVLGIGLALLVDAGPVRADDVCQSFTFDPLSMEMDTHGIAAYLRPTWPDQSCGDEPWTVNVPDLKLSLIDDGTTANPGYVEFQPKGHEGGEPTGGGYFYLGNDEAGTHDVVITVGNGKPRTFAGGFTIKRGTYWKYVNAGPEPAKGGSTITVRGRLKRTDWTTATTTTYAGRRAQVVFSSGRRYATEAFLRNAPSVTTGDADASGFVAFPVTVQREGRWYLRFPGDATSAPTMTDAGDLVPLA